MHSQQKLLLQFQQNEITEHHTYLRLAMSTRNLHNRKILERIAEDERAHYDFFFAHTKTNVQPVRRKVFVYYWIARIFWLTFGVKLMERGEEHAQEEYAKISAIMPHIDKIIDDEKRHENDLLSMIQEKKLQYIGSIVLGLNDALVELTGTLAWITFAFQNTQLIALSGLIMGIAASCSMAASEYLSKRTEKDRSEAIQSAIYTGIAYIGTVILLILPFLLLANCFVALGVSLVIALCIIAVFNFYISIAKDLSFKARFFEMAGLSMGVALFSFGIGYVIRVFLGVEV
jgi:vacuolar iron transporter family protein